MSEERGEQKWSEWKLNEGQHTQKEYSEKGETVWTIKVKVWKAAGLMAWQLLHWNMEDL